MNTPYRDVSLWLDFLDFHGQVITLHAGFEIDVQKIDICRIRFEKPLKLLLGGAGQNDVNIKAAFAG